MPKVEKIQLYMNRSSHLTKMWIKKTVATGSIKPRKEVQIKPQVSGIVDQLFVEAGDLVSKGQRIAKIKLIPSPVNINNAESGVALARIRYQEAQRELERQRQVFESNLDVQTALSNFENARQEEERSRQLYEDGGGLRARLQSTGFGFKCAQNRIGECEDSGPE